MVLAVDDDEAVVEAIQLLLGDSHDVVGATDAMAAIEHVRTRPVDLVLLDILLPRLDGLEALRELRALRPDLPVVMLTAVRTVQSAVAAMRAGAVDYVTKPFSERDLLDAVERAGRVRSARAALAGRPGEESVPRVALAGGDLGIQTALAVVLESLAVVDPIQCAPGDAPWAGGRDAAAFVGIVDDGHEVEALEAVRALRRQVPERPVYLVVPRELLRDLGDLGPAKVYALSRSDGWVGRLIDRMCRYVGRAPRVLGVHSSRAIEHVAERIGASLHVPEVAKALGVSDSHLAHYFRAETGLPLRRFITMVRVRMAAQLLTASPQKVGQVASDLGFFDASHMHRVIRRYAAGNGARG
jgi:CheY-like chemotaxis protein/AraC-like DNA-binding protein